MRVYLDACCLNRPFDDQSHQRIRLETEAVNLFMHMAMLGEHDWVTSEVVEDELSRIADDDRRVSVTNLLRCAGSHESVKEASLALARTYVAQGIAAMDALHFAVAETGKCDILLTTDDAFVRKAARVQPPAHVRVVNPARWIAEVLEQ